MIEIILDFPPLFVHFPIGLFIVSILLLGFGFVILAARFIHHIRKGRKSSLPVFWKFGYSALGCILLGITSLNGDDLEIKNGMDVVPMEKNIGESHPHAVDESTPAGAVEGFHHALTQGDKKAVYRLLAEDVLIFESGGAERSRAEYAGHHMPLDMEFSKNMKREMTAQTVQESGDTAIVISENRTKGTFKDKEYNLLGKETIVLKRMEGRWTITHIHWSSMPAGK